MRNTIFPRNYLLTKGVILRGLLRAGESWQIYLTQNQARVLVVTAELHEFWKNLGIIDETLFKYYLFNKTPYFFFYSDEEYDLSCISEIRDFVTPEEALSYAIALKETRNILPVISLRNGIFIERISRILPMINEVEPISDEIILGTWLTGGLVVPANSTRRMLQVQPLLNEEDLERIIAAAGLRNTLNEQDREKIEHTNKDVDKAVSGKRSCPFTLPGRQELEKFLIDNVIDIIENPETYDAMNISFPGAFILQGPPGCGKSYAVEQLIDYLGWPVFYVEAGTVGSAYIHETSKKIATLFKEAIENAPSVLVIDEMESFLSTRSQSTDASGHHKEEIAEFLRQIPLASQNKVLIIGMTNMIDSIDPAIRRRGRFDNIIEVGMPSSIEIQQVIDSMLETLPHDDDLDTKELADLLDGLPLSDVSYVIRESARLTAKNHFKTINKKLILSIARIVDNSHKRNKRSIGFFNE